MDDEFARNMKENLKSGRTARRNQEKIKEIKKMFDELEISFDAIQDTKDMDHTQVARDIQKIKKILEDN
jgi:methionyl-tRNA synthetase|tara:strand:- start:155 stop:361 length:207 start_codon:yes stop_codon:yes gene_type:complete